MIDGFRKAVEEELHVIPKLYEKTLYNGKHQKESKNNLQHIMLEMYELFLPENKRKRTLIFRILKLYTFNKYE